MFKLHYLLSGVLGVSQIFAFHHQTTNQLQPTPLSRLSAIKNPFRDFKAEDNIALRAIIYNPIGNIIRNTYSFFYFLPRKNLPYDSPWTLFRNNTAEFLSWYQYPHNLPPFGYLGSGYPADFFCYGLPGAILPLGNWDPFGFAQVQRSVVVKYRESEIKHGRLAMMAVIGWLTQETEGNWGHLLYPKYSDMYLGGMAMTQMAAFRQLGEEGLDHVHKLWPALPPSALLSDYGLFILALVMVEVRLLFRHWQRWGRAEVESPFDHHIGIGEVNQAVNRVGGDWGFDPLRLLPDPNANELQADLNWILSVELSHGRLAMIAWLGLFAQETVTGIPAISSLWSLLDSSHSLSSYSDGNGIKAVIESFEAWRDGLGLHYGPD